jgi:hypothetical protein
MRLYPKRLENETELLAEKHRLKMQRKEMDKGSLFSLGDVMGSTKKGKSAGGAATAHSEDDGLGGLLGSLLTGGSMFELGMKFGAPLLRKLGGAVGTAVGGAGKKAGKNAFRWVTKEVLGGYLKWKAIELSYDGIKHVIESRKKKKEASK